MRHLMQASVVTTWLVLLRAFLQVPFLESLEVKICIPYPEGASASFRKQCTTAVAFANREDLEFVCVEGGSADKCISQIASGEAHLTTLDGADVIRANREHGILPLVSESTRGGVPGGTYYAVAVVNKDFCSNETTLADLRGQRSCHTGYRKLAGWKIPVGTLLKDLEDFKGATEMEDVEDDAELVDSFFSQVCAPRLSDNGPKNSEDGEGQYWEPLCSACKGDCSTNEQYYDYSGAFRCLVEGRGDVAFVQHTTVLDYAADGESDIVKRAWANKTKDEFRLLCRHGGCAEVTEYRDCHLSVSPSRALVTSRSLGYKGENETLGLEIQNAILVAARREWFLEETTALTSNFLWSAGVTRLNDVVRGMETYVPSEVEETFNAFDELVEGTLNLSNASTLRSAYCAYTDEEFAFCERMIELESEIGPEIEWDCIKLDSVEECLQAIQNGEADWRTVPGFYAYIGFKQFGLTSVLAENGTLGGGRDYHSVALVKNEFCDENTTLADLQGTRSCHTGYRRNAGWDIPIGALISQGIMEPSISNPAVANDAETVAHFFNGSCAPIRDGITPVSSGNSPYDPICSICKNTCDASSPYSGYGGAYSCLVDSAGDVAFVKHTTVSDHSDEDSLDDFKLVCPEKSGCAPVQDFEDCNLGIISTRSVVVSDKNPNKVELANKLLRMSQTDAFIQLVFNESVNSENYIFHADDTLIELKNGTEDFLGDTLHIYEALQELDLEQSSTVRVCIPYPAMKDEIQDCNQLFASVEIPDLSFECTSGQTADGCILQLYNEEAQLTALDGGDVLRGLDLYGIVPLLAELEAGAENGSFYSVAVVNKEFCEEGTTLLDLEGRSTCHSGYRTMSGWMIPVGALAAELDDFYSTPENNSIQDDAELVFNFFYDICAPGVRGNGPQNTDDESGALWEDLCSGCIGDCSTNDIYYGDAGAFRCLMEGQGDVAFVKHTTVSEYAMDGSRHIVERDWAKKNTSDFRLLCRTGGCAPIESYETCNLALAPTPAIVGSAALGPDGELSELGAALTDGIIAAVNSEEFFSRARGLVGNFPFSPSALSVVPIEDGYEEYIKPETAITLEAFFSLLGDESAEETEDTVVFCAATSEQMDACDSNLEAFNGALGPDLTLICVEEDSIEDCFMGLETGDVHFTAANAGEIYKGHLDYNLSIIAAEAIGSSRDTFIHSVILVKSEDCSNEDIYFSDYATGTACFSALNTETGWNTPISLMASQRLIGIVSNTTESSNAVASVLRFFDSVCAPHEVADESTADGLCSACMDECSPSGIYSGPAGAVRCLMDQDNGIAITDSSVFVQGLLEDVSLLCPFRRGCSNISQYSDCNFGETPTDAIVVSQNADPDFISLLQSALIEVSSSQNYTSILGTTRDAGELAAVRASVEAFLDEYEQNVNTMSNIESNAGSYSNTSFSRISTSNDDEDESDDDASLLSAAQTDGNQVDAAPTQSPSLSLTFFVLLFSFVIINVLL